MPSPSPSVTPLPKGEALAGRFTSYWTPEVRQDAKGRALLTGAAASGQRSLSSCRWPRQRSTTVSEILCFARPDESWPTCQWLPLWGSWRAQARLRGQGFGIPEGAKGPPFGDCSSGRGSFLLGEPMDSFASTFTTFIICHSPQKSSTAQKVYSHSSLGISCIFLAKRVV